MSNLTEYWQRKKFVLNQFLTAAITPLGPAGDKTIVQNWLNGMTTAEAPLEVKLDEVISEFTKVTDRGSGAKPNSDRRSARLVAMVQGAAKVKPDGKGYFANVADLPAGGGSPVTPYKNAVKDASEAAAEFLWAVKNGLAGIGVINKAITNILTANPPASPDPHAFVRNEIVRLQQSIQGFEDDPGRGEGSGFWPSTFISSSSGG